MAYFMECTEHYLYKIVYFLVRMINIVLANLETILITIVMDKLTKFDK